MNIGTWDRARHHMSRDDPPVAAREASQRGIIELMSVPDEIL